MVRIKIKKNTNSFTNTTKIYEENITTDESHSDSDSDSLTEEQLSPTPVKKRRRRKVIYEDSAVINRLFYELNEIRKSIDVLSMNINNTHTPILIEVKKEMLDIDANKIKASLSLTSILGDVLLFKEYYLKDDLKPIKSINQIHFEYWCNGKWNRDDYGKTMIDIITNNIQACYIKVNTTDNYDLDQFIANQQHIFQLRDIKYKRKLLAEIKKQINA
jgi:hypothetical protein